MTPTTPTTTAGGILASLADANGYVALAIQVAGTVIPLGKWLVSEIKSIAGGNVTITYQAVLAADDTELDGIRTMAQADLDAVNAELVRLGKPPLAVPPAAPTT